MHDTTHGLIFGGAQVWALGTVDVQHHGHRIALSIVNKAGGDANLYTKLLKKFFINNLLRCTYSHLIDYAKELLERELHRVREAGFLAYWKQEWSHRVCMPGAVPWGMPTTNNAIERWFRLLKASLGKATKTWLHVFKLLMKLARQDSRKETEFKLTPDMTGAFGRECWTEAQRLWASGTRKARDPDAMRSSCEPTSRHW